MSRTKVNECHLAMGGGEKKWCEQPLNFATREARTRKVPSTTSFGSDLLQLSISLDVHSIDQIVLADQ